MIPTPSLAQLAFASLFRHKMRTSLSMLGIIIGVASVIVMIGIGQGAKMIVEEQVASLGTNLIVVIPGSVSHAGVSFGLGTQITLTPEDAEAIERECFSIKYAAPGVKIPAKVIYKNKNWTPSIGGSSADYVYIRNWHPERGRFFTDQEVKRMAKVAVIGKTVVEKLFGEKEPIGETIRIVDVPFKVIGILQPKGQSFVGTDQDDAILIPYTTHQRRIMGVNFITSIITSATSERSIPRAIQEITLLLRERHRIPPGREDDFTIKTQQEIAETAGAVSHVMTFLLGSVALVSLIVGGIGIMNIMLVSVTERTREIGIRMAVGAQKSDILAQFIMESIVLCLFGGAIGVLLSAVAIMGLTYFSEWLVLLVPEAVLLAFLFSIFVGVFFGYYPASKAAKLKPIEALRYE